MRERLGVFIGPDADRTINRFNFKFVYGIHELQLIIRRSFQKYLGQWIGSHANIWMGARLDGSGEDFRHQRRGNRCAANSQQISFFDPGAVVDQDIGEFA